MPALRSEKVKGRREGGSAGDLAGRLAWAAFGPLGWAWAELASAVLGLGCAWLGWAGPDGAALRHWSGIGWAGLGWAELAWTWLSWDRDR